MDLIANKRAGFLCLGCLIFLTVTGMLAPALAEDANAEGKTNDASAAANQELMRSYLQIQEELHGTQMSMEKIRQEAQAAAATNAQVLEQRLSQMEKTLAAQRLEEFKSVERSDRLVLIAAGIFAVTGFLVLLIAAFLQWTAVNRLAAVTASLTAGHAPLALGMGGQHLLPGQTVEQSTTRFVGVIERLEQRIHDLEASTKSPQTLSEKNLAPEKPGAVAASSASGETSAAVLGEGGSIQLLLNKCETLLKLDKPEAALGCLDEVLLLDPANADALVKKGAALERLQRFDEAIACYDRAIAQDHSMTMAYLYKGGVFNRMERYTEALECYEQALKSRQKGHAANVIIE